MTPSRDSRLSVVTMLSLNLINAFWCHYTINNFKWTPSEHIWRTIFDMLTHFDSNSYFNVHHCDKLSIVIVFMLFGTYYAALWCIGIRWPVAICTRPYSGHCDLINLRLFLNAISSQKSQSWPRQRLWKIAVAIVQNITWWRHQMDTFSRHWPFVRKINSPHKGQWRGDLMFFSAPEQTRRLSFET